MSRVRLLPPSTSPRQVSLRLLLHKLVSVPSVAHTASRFGELSMSRVDSGVGSSTSLLRRAYYRTASEHSASIFG